MDSLVVDSLVVHSLVMDSLVVDSLVVHYFGAWRTEDVFYVFTFNVGHKFVFFSVSGRKSNVTLHFTFLPSTLTCIIMPPGGCITTVIASKIFFTVPT